MTSSCSDKLEGEGVGCAYCGAVGEVYIAFPSSETPWHVVFNHDDYCPLRGWEGYTYASEADAITEWTARQPLSQGSSNVIR